jgi:PadR family transcriptional regulator PadR
LKILTLDESIFLAAILALEDGAYGVAIRRKVLEVAGKAVSYGTLYSHLDQLFRKGYVTKAFGIPSAERGGRSKIYYRVLPAGLEALKSTFSLQHALRRSIRQAVPGLGTDET